MSDFASPAILDPRRSTTQRDHWASGADPLACATSTTYVIGTPRAANSGRGRGRAGAQRPPSDPTWHKTSRSPAVPGASTSAGGSDRAMPLPAALPGRSASTSAGRAKVRRSPARGRVAAGPLKMSTKAVRKRPSIRTTGGPLEAGGCPPVRTKRSKIGLQAVRLSGHGHHMRR
ncbi:hypothetical protein C8Q79DRAFT_106976 [Trametes meyenii]|nr:hypothetical protein C8Q79DRAFT_106976 [Trametes meyenii]